MDNAAMPTPVSPLGPPEGVSITLWTALFEDLGDGSDRFIQALADQLRESHASDEGLARWSATLRSLRRHLLPSIGDLETMICLEDRLHQADELVAEATRRLSGTDEKHSGQFSAESYRFLGAPSALPSSATDLTRGIVSRLQQAPDTESVLRIALEELGSLLGARVAVARLGTREQLLSAESDSDES